MSTNKNDIPYPHITQWVLGRLRKVNKTNFMYSWAIVETWLAERSLPTSEDTGSNHVTTIAQEYKKFVLFTFLTLGITQWGLGRKK